ncbi:MAG: DNRLRE domain-containing protein [Candidatus Hydrogenedentes bacterium]|nr:DNRLRE domain-containing protein [Candidatus Hydrogenedentota bacterium]
MKWKQHILAALCVLVPLTAGTETFVFEQGLGGYEGFRDTTLFEDLVNNAGGGIDGLFSGTIRTGFLRRALLKVDLSNIPQDAVLTSVRLEMFVERSGGNFGDVSYGLHRVTSPWGEGIAAIPGHPGGVGTAAAEGDATWNESFFMQSAWTTPGGDFLVAASATGLAGQQGATIAWEGQGLVADVQAWLNNPDANYGWAILATEEGVPQRTKKFSSSEASTNRPRLIVVTEGGEGEGEGEGEGSGCLPSSGKSWFPRLKDFAADLFVLAAAALILSAWTRP